MENNFDREKFKEKKKAELASLYDAANEETLRIAGNPDRLTEYLRVQARFDRYSVTNAILLLHQFPEAQQLKTFEEWKRAGASVAKGEKSISVLEPSGYTRTDGSTARSYRIKKLFDISQTDMNNNDSSFLTGVSDRSIIKALLLAGDAEILAMETDWEKDSFFNRRQRKIYLKEGVEPDDFFRVAAASIAEAKLSDQVDSGSEEELKNKAEAAAFMLCIKYGIDTGTLKGKLSENALQMEPREIKAELSEIRQVFTEIAISMDAFIREEKKTREECDYDAER